jgi:hypothetical protein
MPQQIPQQSNANNLWRGAVIPAAFIAIISIIAGAIFKGAPGFWGSLLASATVILFFSVHLLISKFSENLDPISTMALALLSYVAKVGLMGALLIVVTKTTSPESVDRPTFAISALSITAAWLMGEIRTFVKLRFQLPLPQTKGSNASSEANFKSGDN